MHRQSPKPLERRPLFDNFGRCKPRGSYPEVVIDPERNSAPPEPPGSAAAPRVLRYGTAWPRGR